MHPAFAQYSVKGAAVLWLVGLIGLTQTGPAWANSLGDVFLDVRAAAEEAAEGAERELARFAPEFAFVARYHAELTEAQQRLSEALEANEDDGTLLRLRNRVNRVLAEYERARELEREVVSVQQTVQDPDQTLLKPYAHKLEEDAAEMARLLDDEATTLAELNEAGRDYQQLGEEYAQARRTWETAKQVVAQEGTTGMIRTSQARLASVLEAPDEAAADERLTFERAQALMQEVETRLNDYESAVWLGEWVDEAVAAVREAGADEPASSVATRLELLADESEASLDRVQLLSEELNLALRELDRLAPYEPAFNAAMGRQSPAFPEGMEAARLEKVDEFSLPAEGWRLAKDERVVGYFEGWYEPGFDDSHWHEAEIEEFWREFLSFGYIGVGWYRATIEVPEMSGYDALGLEFGGADENGWVWIDGQFVGQQNEGIWDKTFQLDVTEAVTPGESHQVTVRVKNTVANGGIWEPVRLLAWRDRSP